LNDYEIMLLLDPELADERSEEIIQRIRTSVEGANGTWDGHEPWGRRRLEYEIDHKGEAVYHLLLFTAPPETLAEITRVLKITDGVIRHGAYRRVKGASTKAPAQSPAPVVAEPEPEPEPVAVETAAEPVTSEPADDTVQVAE
jgi:small subunit ribosomal protein S6